MCKVSLVRELIRERCQWFPLLAPEVFSCDKWDDYTVAQFAAFAQHPDTIGEGGRKCTITSSSSTACNYYVKYDEDGTGYKGLSFQGTPGVGGTGCCSSVTACSTLNGAASWLKSQHKDLCCGGKQTLRSPHKRQIIHFLLLNRLYAPRNEPHTLTSKCTINVTVAQINLPLFAHTGSLSIRTLRIYRVRLMCA